MIAPVVVAETALVVTVKLAEVFPAPTVTLAGTVAELLLLVSETATPPVGAGPLRFTVPVEEEALVPTVAPGDALVFLGSTLHGGGGNASPVPRRGIVISYCLGWLKPFELQWLVYPPAIARRFSPELAALVGYAQHRPNLGNVEGQCPSVLLGEVVPDHLGAIDALRPEQEAMAAAFLAGQK